MPLTRTAQTQQTHAGPHRPLGLVSWLSLTWSSSQPYRSQCRTTRARWRFQISRNTVAVAGAGWGEAEASWCVPRGVGLRLASPNAQRLTPQSHEDGKQHGALVVEKVGKLGRGARGPGAAFPGPSPGQGEPASPSLGAPVAASPGANLGKGAGFREPPVPAAVVAARAHVDVVGLADLLAAGAGAGVVAALSCSPSWDPAHAQPHPFRTRPALSLTPPHPAPPLDDPAHTHHASPRTPAPPAPPHRDPAQPTPPPRPLTPSRPIVTPPMPGPAPSLPHST